MATWTVTETPRTVSLDPDELLEHFARNGVLDAIEHDDALLAAGHDFGPGETAVEVCARLEAPCPA